MQISAQTVASIADGIISAEDLATACLERIKTAADGPAPGWAEIDPDASLAQARAADELRRAGKPLGPLHGIPVAVGDTIDICATAIRLETDAHHGPAAADATVVSKLRESGAVILGRTATTPFGAGEPSAMANPHDPTRTSGPSGAAAAVAAGHVPMAVERQQGGEVILSASYCGVFGLTPSRGMISRSGTLRVSEHLDRIGVIAQSVEDLALLSDALTGHDAADSATYARAKPNMAKGVMEEPPVEPNFVFLKLPYANRLSASASDAFDELLDAMEGRVQQLEPPPSFVNLVDHRNIVLNYELARGPGVRIAAGPGHVNPALAAAIRHGQAISEDQFAESLALIDVSRIFLEDILTDFDAIVTPGARDAAPVSPDDTGDTTFSAIFDFCGLPCLSMPLLFLEQERPLGVQLVGGPEEDARLLRSARWLQAYLDED